MSEIKNEELFGWSFVYNPYVDEWWGCKQEFYRELRNGGTNIKKSKGIIKGIKVLIEGIGSGKIK